MPASVALRRIVRAWPRLSRREQIAALLLALLGSEAMLPPNGKRVPGEYWNGFSIDRQAAGFVNADRRSHWRVCQVKISTKQFEAWLLARQGMPPPPAAWSEGIARRDYRHATLPLIEEMHDLLTKGLATCWADAARKVMLRRQVTGVSHRATVKRLVAYYSKLHK
jgi:hypothetical protein